MRPRRSQNRSWRGAGIELVEVGIEVARQQLDHGFADPGRPVDAVGHRQDLPVHDAAPRAVRRVGMEFAHRVGAVGQPQAEGRHVELTAVAIGAEAELQDLLDRDLAGIEQRSGDAPDQIGFEALVARRHGRVDREHRVALDLRPGVVERPPLRDDLAGTFGEQERRVAFVEVPHGWSETQGAQRAHAGDP